MPLSQAYTNACPLFTRARSLGARTGEAFSVSPKTGDRVMWIVCGLCGLFTALWTYAGGAG